MLCLLDFPFLLHLSCLLDALGLLGLLAFPSLLGYSDFSEILDFIFLMVHPCLVGLPGLLNIPPLPGLLGLQGPLVICKSQCGAFGVSEWVG